MRVLGLDYGTKTVGVALSDALMMTAQGLETIERKSAGKLRRTLARIEEIIREYDEQGEQHEVGLIVLGYPLNMDDSEGERCRATTEFQEALERRTGLPVVLWDERLTTVEADGILSEGGVRKKDRKTYIDKVAAAIILQNYLDAQAEKNTETTAE